MSPVSPTPDCITRKFREFIGGIQVALSFSSRRYLVCDWVILTTYLFHSYFILFYSSILYQVASHLNGSVMIYFGIHSFILVRMFIVKTICCNFYPLILFVYLSIKMLTDVTLFRMAPPTRQNPECNDGSQANPPPPPPPPEAWQAIVAATNANA